MKVFLMLALACLFAFPPPASAESWTYKLGPEMPGEFYSVGPYVPGLGLIPTGQYGGGRIAGIDPATLDYRVLADIHIGPGHESWSGFMLIDGGAGLNAFTESNAGAQIYTAWAAQGWKFRLTQTIRKWPWALLGPTAARHGLVGISEGRRNRSGGGALYGWLGAHWGPVTPTIPGLIIWDAAPWRGGYVLGCSIGQGRYLEEFAGRLYLVQDGSFRLVHTPAMAGALRVAALEGWPGRLWVCTVWGEIWYTDDLENFTLWHHQPEDYGHNAFLYELGDRLVVASSKGKVWEYANAAAAPALVAEIPNTAFMSLAPVELPNNGWCLVGPLTYGKRGQAVSRPVGFYFQ